MQSPSFLVAYLAAGFILAAPPTAAAQHMGQQHPMGSQDHMRDMMQRMNTMIESMHQKNADLASRMGRMQEGPMREHQAMMVQAGRAVEQMAVQMKAMLEGMQRMTQDPDILTDQEMLRAMNQFHEHMSSMMRQMEGPMRALHQMQGSTRGRTPNP